MESVKNSEFRRHRREASLRGAEAGRRSCERIVWHQCAGPSGLDSVCLKKPRAYARGYFLPALRASRLYPFVEPQSRQAFLDQPRRGGTVVAPRVSAGSERLTDRAPKVRHGSLVPRNHTLMRMAMYDRRFAPGLSAARSKHDAVNNFRASLEEAAVSRPGREAGIENGQTLRAPKVRHMNQTGCDFFTLSESRRT